MDCVKKIAAFRCMGSEKHRKTDSDRDLSDTVEEVGSNLVNMFTVERDTSLAEGAGAPGSTDVGGMAHRKTVDEAARDDTRVAKKD
jgi:hypothetical protein